MTLWGGIPQDLVLQTHDRSEFEAAVTQTASTAREDGHVLLGIADRVPADADLDRIQAIPELIQ